MVSTEDKDQEYFDTFRRARIGTGLSHDGFAELVGVADGRTVRRWEAGEKDIPGSVWLVLELLYEIPEARKYLNLNVDPNWRDIDLNKRP